MATKKKSSNNSAGSRSKASSTSRLPANVSEKKPVPSVPPKEPAKSKKKGEDNLSRSLTDARQFLKESYIEFQKISWPDRQEVLRATISVLFLVFVITVTVLLFDWVLAQGFFGPLEHFARMHGGGVGRVQ